MQKSVYEYISKQTNDPIVEWRICELSGDDFAIFQSQKELEEKFENISPQRFSHENVMRQLMMFRNERKLYKNISKKSGKPLISIYPEELNEIVYHKDERWEDEFIKNTNNPIDIENIQSEFLKLNKEIPKQALVISNNENVEYANYVDGCKNVYMSFLIYYDAENIFYSYRAIDSKYIFDTIYTKKSELIFDSMLVYNSSFVFNSMNIENSSNIYFSNSLVNCNNCIFCNNLHNKSYFIDNKAYSKEEYLQELEKIKEKMRSYKSYQDELLKKYKEVLSRSIYKSTNTTNCENCVGNNIQDSKGVKLSLDVLNSQNAINIRGEDTNNALNFIGGTADNCVYASRTGWANKCFGTFNVLYSNNIFHSIDIYNSEYILFCRGLKDKKYCILNQQYSKEDFEEKKEKIREFLQRNGERGHFFDINSSPFPYNDTVAIDNFPIKKIVDTQGNILQSENTSGKGTIIVSNPDQFISDAILDLGGKEKIKIKRRTKENDINIPDGIQTIKSQEIPDNIEKVGEDILNKAIICEISGRPFRIIKPELEFYQKYNLPIPHKHPDIRYQEKLKIKPGREFYLRKCDKCNIETISVYPQNFKSKVYCETCYNKEIYG